MKFLSSTYSSQPTTISSPGRVYSERGRLFSFDKFPINKSSVLRFSLFMPEKQLIAVLSSVVSQSSEDSSTGIGNLNVKVKSF